MSESAEFLKLQQGKVDDNIEDLDELLAQLTAEELEELNADFDPDVSSRIIPSQTFISGQNSSIISSHTFISGQNFSIISS